MNYCEKCGHKTTYCPRCDIPFCPNCLEKEDLEYERQKKEREELE